MRATDVRRLVFSSTCAVYGEPAVPGPLNESNPYRPQSAYGASKVAADLMISSFTRAHAFGAVSLRYFNAAGAYGRYGERHTTETHLIPLALRTLTDPERVLQILGTDYPTPDGTAVRDYIHVLDLAEAHILALDALTAGRHEIYNLGSGIGNSVREVVDAIAEVAGRAAERRRGRASARRSPAARRVGRQDHQRAGAGRRSDSLDQVISRRVGVRSAAPPPSS